MNSKPFLLQYIHLHNFGQIIVTDLDFSFWELFKAICPDRKYDQPTHCSGKLWPGPFGNLRSLRGNIHNARPGDDLFDFFPIETPKLTYPTPNFLTFGQYKKKGSPKKLETLYFQGGTGEVSKKKQTPSQLLSWESKGTPPLPPPPPRNKALLRPN